MILQSLHQSPKTPHPQNAIYLFIAFSWILFSDVFVVAQPNVTTFYFTDEQNMIDRFSRQQLPFLFIVTDKLFMCLKVSVVGRVLCHVPDYQSANN